MKRENKKALDDFLTCADAMSDDILTDTEKMLGSMPFILPVLRERPEFFTLSSLADDMIIRPKHLPPRTAELVALAAAAATGAQYCMQVHIRAAAKEGASRDEILDAILIAALVGKTRVLAPALRELCDALPPDTKSR
ncbi:carboxymuconolactone decarboxylase family protein [uncultured Methanoregula sp.]|uniref:carboxymuconolactone decarboxylase family protein n=1 Tax=uncultured Methanoregula sp. TaxID=1005933 RepID=UPI002AAAA4FE|nr:carboxymuconolactone decarboxylase family protein [uncultured Methanoregula sp.]